MPEFHYGRVDVKFADVESLQAGDNIEIVEVNGASSESLQIWDKDARLMDALRTLLWQYRTLFEIGSLNRRRGYAPPALTELVKRWRSERKLARYHQVTD